MNLAEHCNSGSDRSHTVQILGPYFKTDSVHFLSLGSFTSGNQPPCCREAQASLCRSPHGEEPRPSANCPRGAPGQDPGPACRHGHHRKRCPVPSRATLGDIASNSSKPSLLSSTQTADPLAKPTATVVSSHRLWGWFSRWQ